MNFKLVKAARHEKVIVCERIVCGCSVNQDHVIAESIKYLLFMSFCAH